MHIRTRPGNEEVSVRQGWFAEAQIDPFARCAVEPATHLCHVFFGHTVGEVGHRCARASLAASHRRKDG